MTPLKKGLTRLTSVASMAAIATLIALPSFAQETRVSIHREQNANLSDRSANADTNADTNANRSDVSSLDEEFVRHAYQGNNAEIVTSQLALERSENESVRQYAQQMIDEHTQANRLLTDYASQRNIELPDRPVDPLNQAIAERLAPLNGREFDRAYMGAQTNAHLRTLALFQTQIEQGEDQGLRTYAAQLLPNIQGHYQMARQMTPNSYNAEQMRPDMEMNQPLR